MSSPRKVDASLFHFTVSADVIVWAAGRMLGQAVGFAKWE